MVFSLIVFFSPAKRDYFEEEENLSDELNIVFNVTERIFYKEENIQRKIRSRYLFKTRREAFVFSFEIRSNAPEKKVNEIYYLFQYKIFEQTNSSGRFKKKVIFFLAKV